MYDSDELMGWICMRAMHLNGKPLTRFTINCYKSYMKECLKVFESSGYDTFSESFINFYKKYLRKKHHNNYAKVYDKVFVARKLYECLKGSAQVRISFADCHDVSLPEIKSIDYAKYNQSELLEAASEG